MTMSARVLAVVAALGGLVFGLAGLVRAAALAADGRLVWRLPSWWTDLVDEADPWMIDAGRRRGRGGRGRCTSSWPSTS